MSKSFLQQTAKDYDMPFNEVERIANLYPDNFYQKLEEYINNRSKQ
jgi:hypothetical protein